MIAWLSTAWTNRELELTVSSGCRLQRPCRPGRRNNHAQTSHSLTPSAAYSLKSASTVERSEVRMSTGLLTRNIARGTLFVSLVEHYYGKRDV